MRANLDKKTHAMDFKSAYIIFIIRKFAEHYKMSAKQAYLYLRQYAGITFLDDCYEAEHQQTVETAIEDLTIVCRNHGGGMRYA